MKEFDLIIRGGTVVLGANEAICDVGVRDGNCSATARSEWRRDKRRRRERVDRHARWSGYTCTY